jgi:hypothetical protein
MRTNNINPEHQTNTILALFPYVEDYNKFVREKQSTTLWKIYEE